MRACCLFTLVCGLLISGAAQAQTGTDTSTDLQDFLPMAGPADFLTIPSPFVSPHRSVGFGLVVNYVHKPLVVAPLTSSDGTQTDAIGYQVTADFLWSFALWDQLQLGLALPVVVAQSGEGIRPIACSDLADCPIPELASTAIRDIRLDAKVRLARHGVLSAMALAVSTSLPSGDEENFAGQQHPTVSPMFLMGGVHLSRRVDVALALGARLRKQTEVADGLFGSELFARAGIGAEVIRPLHLTLEYFGTLPLTSGARERQELLGGVRYSPDGAGDVTLEAGLGAGLSDAPGRPALRAIVGVRYAPLGRDTDEDGVGDRTDACPAAREDRDGFEDLDGCPDPDNDGDRILDEDDRCDDENEDQDQFEDSDGCPEPDNDQDGVLDEEDRCPAQAEDRDEFEDTDGCADPDNDQDGVLDPADHCPAEPEDRDGWQDEDGCPEPDNDQDGLIDGQDRCPSVPEDRDGWQDEDGCPDPDDDADGVADAQDRCAREPETINGRTDEDGCPEAGATSLTFADDHVVLPRALRFAPRATTLATAAAPLVAQLAQLLRGRVNARFSIIARGDRPSDDPAEQERARLRAEALRGALVQQGIAAARLDVSVGAPIPGGAAPQIEVHLLPETARSPTPGAP